MQPPEFIGFPIISRTISTPTTAPIQIPAAVIFLSAVKNILLNVLLLIFLAALKSVLPEICSAPWNVSVPTVSDIPQPIVPAIKNRPALPAMENITTALPRAAPRKDLKTVTALVLLNPPVARTTTAAAIRNARREAVLPKPARTKAKRPVTAPVLLNPPVVRTATAALIKNVRREAVLPKPVKKWGKRPVTGNA